MILLLQTRIWCGNMQSTFEDPENNLANKQTTATAPGFTHDVRPNVALRFQNVQGYAMEWAGSVTAYTWPKVLAYCAYTTAVVLFLDLSCDKESNDPRCIFANKKLNINLMVELWMTFTAFLFQSFVNAGIQQFRRTLTAVRILQGRFNELSLLLHSHVKQPQEGDGRHHSLPDAPCLMTARRFLSALPYIMYSGKRFGGDTKGRDCLAQAQAILEPQEFQLLLQLKESDRPYAILTWLSMITQHDIRTGRSLNDVGGALALQIPRAIEQVRGTLGGLVDSLDDPILPLAFANLIIVNVYLIALLIPFITVEMLGYYAIPAATIYFWFLDGMVTFVFFCHEPFLGMRGPAGGEMQPLIAVDRAILEMVAGVPRRFPGAIAQLPASVLELVKEKEL